MSHVLSFLVASDGSSIFFFFQAEDGIRDYKVTGVQTCALPISGRLLSRFGKQSRGNYPYETLTAREQEVLQLLARGLRNKEIAARLNVSERTVKDRKSVV